MTEICAQGAAGMQNWLLLLVAAASGVGIWCPEGAVASVRLLDEMETKDGGWARKVSANETSSRTSPGVSHFGAGMLRVVVAVLLANVWALIASAPGIMLESADFGSSASRNVSVESESDAEPLSDVSELCAVSSVIASSMASALGLGLQYINSGSSAVRNVSARENANVGRAGPLYLESAGLIGPCTAAAV